MIGKNLAYWVFTSGEEGVHGLDWGVKHASKSFPDRYKLDSRYPFAAQGLFPASQSGTASKGGGTDPPALAGRGKGWG